MKWSSTAVDSSSAAKKARTLKQPEQRLDLSAVFAADPLLPAKVQLTESARSGYHGALYSFVLPSLQEVPLAVLDMICARHLRNASGLQPLGRHKFSEVIIPELNARMDECKHSEHCFCSALRTFINHKRVVTLGSAVKQLRPYYDIQLCAKNSFLSISINELDNVVIGGIFAPFGFTSNMAALGKANAPAPTHFRSRVFFSTEA
jgi:hypothetical protein